MTSRQNRDDHERIIARLRQERPVPSPGFRGRLRRELARSGGHEALRWPHSDPRRLGLACVGMGAALLTFAAAGLLGVGAMAPSDAFDAVETALRHSLRA